jgi:hypothetical protein
MKKAMWIVAALLVVGITVPAAQADSYNISWSGGFGAGSVTVGTTNEGGGEFLITSLSGTQNGHTVSLEATGTYGSNNNLIFPGGSPSSPCASSIFGSVSASSELDNCGFSFTDGTTIYNIFAPYTDVVPGTTYFECSEAVTNPCVGLAPQIASELTAFSITPVVASTPEPPGLVLLAAGLLILLGISLWKPAGNGALA